MITRIPTFGPGPLNNLAVVSRRHYLGEFIGEGIPIFWYDGELHTITARVQTGLDLPGWDPAASNPKERITHSVSMLLVGLQNGGDSTPGNDEGIRFQYSIESVGDADVVYENLRYWYQFDCTFTLLLDGPELWNQVSPSWTSWVSYASTP